MPVPIFSGGQGQVDCLSLGSRVSVPHFPKQTDLHPEFWSVRHTYCGDDVATLVLTC